MYLPRSSDHRNPAVTCRLLRERPLATLVSLDPAAWPFMSEWPIKRPPTGSDDMPTNLLGQLTRNNPQVQHLATHPESHAAVWVSHPPGTPRERQLARWMQDLALTEHKS
jgi:predicted FMN-binding regulatory protein PaiB